MVEITFRAFGIPQSQGSMRAFVPKGGKFPIVTHQKSPALKAWREVVALAVPKGVLLDGAVRVQMDFYMPIPKARPKELRTEKQRHEWMAPWRKPDLDKMVRAVLDAMTGVVFHDDSQVVVIHATKSYSGHPGVEVWISRVESIL